MSIRKLRFLHITDSHLSESDVYKSIDKKVDFPGVELPSRREVLRETLRSFAKSLRNQGHCIDAVLCSGDATLRGNESGQKELRSILLEELAEVGVSASNLVVTPGNHDVVKGELPGTPSKYSLFMDTWMGKGSVIPFLDGVHDESKLNYQEHFLKSKCGTWAVFPINSANWSQISPARDPKNKDLVRLREFIEESNNEALIRAFEKISTYDAARVSDRQLTVLQDLVKHAGNVQLRIAVIHHHLLPVDGREELKPFADFTNLGTLRQVLRELGFHVIVHGHKHTKTAYYDHIYSDQGAVGKSHRVLAISGGTFGDSSMWVNNIFQIIEIDDYPHAPICSIRSIKPIETGRSLSVNPAERYPLWDSGDSERGPLALYGESMDDIYRRALQAVQEYPDRTLICTVDMPVSEVIPFPSSYPHLADAGEKKLWFQETVRWWQLPSSRSDSRLPYIHGARLRRFGGWFDQIDRIIRLLKEKRPTSRAIALIVDPARDFQDGRHFASFCFIQFCVREEGVLDCIGYYRVQEFNYWWPVNVAELRHLQVEIADKVKLRLGRVTTITPYPRLSEDIRQPTRVAVPIIDQWADSHPKRIAMMALATVTGETTSHGEGHTLWKKCLDDIGQAATSFHNDGVPIAVEGLELLYDWILAAGGSTEINAHIESLIKVNRGFAGSENTPDKFDNWRLQVTKLVEQLNILLSIDDKP